MIRLITPSEVADLAYTNSVTYEEGLIKDSVIEATQLRWIKPMLGNNLWDTLESEYGSFSTVNQTLVDKLKAPLAFFCKHELVPDSSINSTAAGLQVIRTDYSTAATDRQRGEIQEQALVHATALLDEVTRWIEKDANITDYPDYTIAGNISSSTNNRGGIVL